MTVGRRKKPEAEKHPGALTATGSWQDEVDPGRFPHSRMSYLGSLILLRRTTEFSPRQFAMKIEADRAQGNEHAAIFSDATLEHWLDFSGSQDWSCVRAERTSEQMLIHEGRGGTGWVWQGAHCVPRDVAVHEVALEDAGEKVAELIGALAGKFSNAEPAGAGTSPPRLKIMPADERYFEPHKVKQPELSLPPCT